MSTISNKFVTIKTNKTTNKSFAIVKLPYKTVSPKGTDISNYKFIVDDFTVEAKTTTLNIIPNKPYHLTRTKAKDGATPINPIDHIYDKSDLETIDGYILGSDLIESMEASNNEYKAYKEKKYQEFLSSVAFI